ncbi:cysteine dioxygenase family protein [uncultured Jatrophihabitans sp.]|uniref:cysteine dioxygenase n=1 Tax=uncultured Jatrophihabitans sp. TaxID=1610747 RepID=UPI0035CC734C
MRRAQSLFFGPLQLIEFTRFYADEVAGGQYPFVEYDEDERWHQRIYRDRRVDIWLISWLPTQGTQLHDHGGSAGSFTVLSGTLTEAVAGGGLLREHERTAGNSVGFGAHYVHDVRNVSDAPAVSVHAYSPPLTTMTYYDLADGKLETITSLATEDPEPEFAPPARQQTARPLAAS